jgi:lipopolysaccharide biosynthesis protein
MIWKEEVRAQFRVLSCHLSWENAKKPWETSVRIGGLWADIWIQDLPNTKQSANNLAAMLHVWWLNYVSEYEKLTQNVLGFKQDTEWLLLV